MPQMTRLPIIEQAHRARNAGELSRVLLQVPDAILLKYSDQFFSAVTRLDFSEGETFLTLRIANLHAVRSETDGALPSNIEADFRQYARHLGELVKEENVELELEKELSTVQARPQVASGDQSSGATVARSPELVAANAVD